MLDMCLPLPIFEVGTCHSTGICPLRRLAADRAPLAPCTEGLPPAARNIIANRTQNQHHSVRSRSILRSPSWHACLSSGRWGVLLGISAAGCRPPCSSVPAAILVKCVCLRGRGRRRVFETRGSWSGNVEMPERARWAFCFQSMGGEGGHQVGRCLEPDMQ